MHVQTIKELVYKCTGKDIWLYIDRKIAKSVDMRTD